jgi:signal transduction histidine kinase
VRIGIKFKFSIFLAALLLLTVFILSLLVLNGVKDNQKAQYEQYLKQQAQTANTYFLQNILAEANKVPQTFLSSKGREFAEQLELISGQTVVLYDENGSIVSKKVSHTEVKNVKLTLEYALANKTAYLVEDDALYYMAPLRVGGEQVGVVQFNYSLEGHQEFYRQIRQLFILVGAGVFFLSFILAYFYFDSFANSIIRLGKTVDLIGEGHYDTEVLSRQDEIGRLSKGIQAMSLQIKKTMQDMETEQEKLTLAVGRLSLLDQQQKQFIGNVTHEFKTPLTSIKAYIDLLEMYPEDKELLETARDNIKSETQKLYEMVVKVLQLSAMDKYDFEYNMEKLELKQTILTVLNSLSGKLEKFGISLKTELTESYVEADRDSINIILMNLLDNAIKYNKAEGSIFVKNYCKDDQSVIEISDTGIGIPEELVQAIFEPFYTVDKNRSRENGGVGLGLSLAKKHARIQGGSITLVNTSPAGTTFRITLPALPS